MAVACQRAAAALHRATRASFARRGLAAPARAVLDEKTKSEMRELHAADPTRWTAAALAARFGAPAENAKAIVRLAALRSRVPAADAEAATELERAWTQLGVPQRTSRARHARAATTPARPASRAPAVAPAVEPEAAAEEPDAMETAGGDGVGTTATAEWAREQIELGEIETMRASTFAFIEVGKGLEDHQRAIWLRDGRTGCLRAPSARERARLLDQRRVVE